MIKTIFISMMLVSNLLATNFYVNRDAGGSNNGTSWTDAWNQLSDINWASISAGDTIYVSGGADSTVYGSADYLIGRNSAPFYSFASGNPVIICRAYQSGHNGEVYISNVNNTQSRLFSFFGVSNVKLYGFKIVDGRTQHTGTGGYIGGGEVDSYQVDSLLFIENCHYIGNGHNYGFYLIGYKITFKNCIIENLENSYDDPQDLFGMSGGVGDYTFDGNTIITRCSSLTTSEHQDVIQFSDYGTLAPPRGIVTNIIKNNLIIQFDASSAWNKIIYSDGALRNTRWLIYNNIIVTQSDYAGSAPSAMMIGGMSSTYSPTQDAYILNNTIIQATDGTDGDPIAMGAYDPETEWDSMVVKNNLIVRLGVSEFFYDVNTNPDNSFELFADYNGYYTEDWDIDFSYGEGFGYYNYTDWLAEGYDANADTSSILPTFSEIYGTDFEDYQTSTSQDKGENLWDEYPFLRTDALGNARPEVGAWDIGALEYQGSSPVNNAILKGSAGKVIFDSNGKVIRTK